MANRRERGVGDARCGFDAGHLAFVLALALQLDDAHGGHQLGIGEPRFTELALARPAHVRAPRARVAVHVAAAPLQHIALRAAGRADLDLCGDAGVGELLGRPARRSVRRSRTSAPPA